ncbi:diguanylate cyclase [Actinomyces oricola]|uniref:diguanylate cyclase n=1 Tax=Actinomyces oricola TaxID=206043 RepID=UPI000FFE675D|nr:diguanylate cyclase [Actinomyces oricola]
MESQVGYERFFDPDDIFFSTTDSRGVIRRTNRTFETLSRYPRERLIGAPHNIIRHLDMPAGVFRLMWDDLEAGRPVCAYVINRALDGLDYRVFATIVPLRDGYLSVRIKPLQTATRETVEEIYRRVRSKERELAARGGSRRQIGEHGARELLGELGALGFGSLHDLTRVALPEEVGALVTAGVRVPAAVGLHGPVAQILDAAAQIERETNLLVFELDEYLRLLTALAATRDSMLGVADRVEMATNAVSQYPGARESSRAQSLASRVMELSSECVPALRSLPATMSRVQGAVLELRFSVALMRLMTLMVGRFSRSILDGSEEDPVGSITDLCEALESGFAELEPICVEVERGVDELDAQLGAVVPQLDRIVRRLRQWADLVDEQGAGAYAAPVATLANDGTPEVRDMAALAAECRGLTLPYNAGFAAHQLGTIRTALHQLR